MSGAPRVEFLLRRLVVLAGETRDLLAAGDWEGALPVQDAFDETFASFQRLVETGHPLGREHANDLAQLHHVHAENQRLAEQLRAHAGTQLTQLSNVVKLSGYAPLGSNHRPSPRYVDGSA